jgi:hypothetical protein
MSEDRITLLLEANNAEVEKRRALESRVQELELQLRAMTYQNMQLLQFEAIAKRSAKVPA